MCIVRHIALHDVGMHAWLTGPCDISSTYSPYILRLRSAHALFIKGYHTMLCRALPPIAALFSLLHNIQLFLQPYKERYQGARDALKGWWRVRAERLSLTARLMRLVSLRYPEQ